MKDIVGFDVETTGLSPQNNFIIQLGMIRFSPKTWEITDRREWYIEPAHEYEIAPEAFEKHGISKEFLRENGRSMKDVGPEILEFIGDCDYLTYNGNTFDVKFLYKDLAMFGYELPMEGRVFYDAFLLYKLYHPTTLEAIYEKYTGKKLENAHNACADIEATLEVFKCMYGEVYSLPFQDNDPIEDWATMKECQMLSPEGSIRHANLPGQPEKIVFTRGKHKDEEICEVMQKDYNYILWFRDNVASDYTKKMLRRYIIERRKAMVKS